MRFDLGFNDSLEAFDKLLGIRDGFLITTGAVIGHCGMVAFPAISGRYLQDDFYLASLLTCRWNLELSDFQHNQLSWALGDAVSWLSCRGRADKSRPTTDVSAMRTAGLATAMLRNATRLKESSVRVSVAHSAWPAAFDVTTGAQP